jgi:hypothetical protein
VSDLLIRRRATFDRSRTLRFTLERRWDDRPQVCFIGHNPAEADEVRDDMTCTRWMHFARAWGFGGLVGVNLYPLRTSKPEAVRRWADWQSHGPDWGTRDVLLENVDIVAREAKRAALVVACWGAIARDELWVDHVIEEITTGEAPWPNLYVFGLTSAGAPIHPMARGRHRVPNDVQPVLWKSEQ